jgi:hypothetical protein
MITIQEIKAAIKTSLAESKANPNPGWHCWDSWPAGNMAHRHWQAGEHRRQSNRRKLRRNIQRLAQGLEPFAW